MISENKNSCCGCGACSDICPVSAISMVADVDGFIFPHVDEKACIGCGKCERVCPFLNKTEAVEPQVYAAVSTDCDLSASASGGAFSSIASAFIRNGGHVYGCALVEKDGTLTPEHIHVDTVDGLTALKGSKYVQSNTAGVFSDIKKRLKNGERVLFCGTPCQVSAVKNFAGNIDGLYTAELICHGVPSAKLFADYLAFEEKKRGQRVTDIKFRCKDRGWALTERLTLEDGTSVLLPPEQSSYYQLFLNGSTYRESCYNCPFASKSRAGDITLGDFWNIDLTHPEYVDGSTPLDESKGISCITVNNDRGNELINVYGGGIFRLPSDYERASKYNRQLLRPSAMPENRAEYLSLSRLGYDKLDRLYRKRLIPIKIKRGIRRAVPKPVKKIIKKILNK